MDWLNEELMKNMKKRYSHDQMLNVDDNLTELAASSMQEAEALRQVLHLKGAKTGEQPTETDGQSSPGIALDSQEASKQLKERMVFNSLGATPEQQKHIDFLNQRLHPETDKTGMAAAESDTARPIRNALDLGKEMRNTGLSSEVSKQKEEE